MPTPWGLAVAVPGAGVPLVLALGTAHAVSSNETTQVWPAPYDHIGSATISGQGEDAVSQCERRDPPAHGDVDAGEAREPLDEQSIAGQPWRMIEGELQPCVDLGVKRADAPPQRILEYRKPAGTVCHSTTNECIPNQQQSSLFRRGQMQDAASTGTTRTRLVREHRMRSGNAADGR